MIDCDVDVIASSRVLESYHYIRRVEQDCVVTVCWEKIFRIPSFDIQPFNPELILCHVCVRKTERWWRSMISSFLEDSDAPSI